MNLPSLPFPVTALPGLEGQFRARVACAVCDAASDYFVRVQTDPVTGELVLQPDPLPIVRFVGYRELPPGPNGSARWVCSDRCFRQAKHEASPFSIDASKFPADPRINHGNLNPATGASNPAKSLEIRTVIAKCANARCRDGEPTQFPIHQRRFNGEWSPSEAKTLTAMGWRKDGEQRFCSRSCSEAHAKAAAPVVQRVVTRLNESRQPEAPSRMLQALPLKASRVRH